MPQEPAPPARHNLFFALSPGAATRTAIAAAAQTLRDGFPGAGRWLNPPRYHLTLRYLGGHAALPAGLTRRAIEAAALVRGVAPFRFALDVVGSFGERRMPVWIGCGAMPPALRGLHEALDAALLRKGFAPAHPVRFVPHVTILRAAQRAPQCAIDPPIEWRVDEFVLVDSEPPAPYRTIGRWPLVP